MVTPLVREAIVTTSPTLLFFRCISKSHRKDKESTFSECVAVESTTKAISD